MTRYTVREDKIPKQLRVRFFRAWINDAKHPDDPTEGASCAWFTDLTDAHRVCDALNMADRLVQAQRTDTLERARESLYEAQLACEPDSRLAVLRCRVRQAERAE